MVKRNWTKAKSRQADPGQVISIGDEGMLPDEVITLIIDVRPVDLYTQFKNQNSRQRAAELALDLRMRERLAADVKTPERYVENLAFYAAEQAKLNNKTK